MQQIDKDNGVILFERSKSARSIICDGLKKSKLKFKMKKFLKNNFGLEILTHMHTYISGRGENNHAKNSC